MSDLAWSSTPWRKKRGRCLQKTNAGEALALIKNERMSSPPGGEPSRWLKGRSEMSFSREQKDPFASSVGRRPVQRSVTGSSRSCEF